MNRREFLEDYEQPEIWQQYDLDGYTQLPAWLNTYLTLFYNGRAVVRTSSSGRGLHIMIRSDYEDLELRRWADWRHEKYKENTNQSLLWNEARRLGRKRLSKKAGEWWLVKDFGLWKMKKVMEN